MIHSKMSKAKKKVVRRVETKVLISPSISIKGKS